jgi:uncharacterized protein
MTEPRDLLQLNVGFIIHQTAGYFRDFPLEYPGVYHFPPDLTLNNLVGNARVTRTAQGLLVQVQMQARSQTECVRCLEPFEQALEVEFTDLYAFNHNSITESGLLVPDNGKINLAPILREEMLLAFPISPLCRVDCKGLCPTCGENLNQKSCNHEKDSIDPRLELLRSLKNNE